MQTITFFRMQDLQKLWHFCQCGDSQVSQHVHLLVAHCIDVPMSTTSREEAKGKQRRCNEALRAGQINFNYITPL